MGETKKHNHHYEMSYDGRHRITGEHCEDSDILY